MRSIYQGSNYDYVYGLNNYIIEEKEGEKEKNNKLPLCVIYCSSSGLYYPNTEEQFVNAFVKRNDKFEWRRNRIHKADKEIWIRDITKEFYVRGINKRIDSIDELLVFMEKETRGFDLITVGSSGGGYIATLIGCYLNAKWVYCFSGFFDLNIIDREIWPLVYEYGQQPENRKWYQLRDIIRKSNTKIFYFYPQNLEGDIKQAECVIDLPRVYSFQFKSNMHGVPFKDKFGISVLDRVLNASEDQLLILYFRFQKNYIKKYEWILSVLFIIK